jgi:hypothetical protein
MTIKQLTYLSSFLFLLAACQTNITSTHDVEKNLVTSTPQTFKSIINGDWYQASYIDSIQETKSPFRSQNSLAEYVELSINTNEASGDSLEVGAPGIHEGTSFVIYLKPGLTSTSFPTNIIDEDTASNFYELSYNISINDTSLIILHYNKDKKLIGQTKYLRVRKNSEGALQFMVNKTLFAGNYQAEDSPGNISVLKFTNDGLVTGLPGFKKYYVLTDFVAEPENSVDEVCFDIQTTNQKCYAFEIKGDKIKLYDVKESTDQDTLQRGQLKYKLVKQ